MSEEDKTYTDEDVQKYRTMLRRHDRFYQYSDDYSVWRRGQNARDAINRFEERFPADVRRTILKEEWGRLVVLIVQGDRIKDLGGIDPRYNDDKFRLNDGARLDAHLVAGFDELLLIQDGSTVVALNNPAEGFAHEAAALIEEILQQAEPREGSNLAGCLAEARRLAADSKCKSTSVLYVGDTKPEDLPTLSAVREGARVEFKKLR